jgi:Rod binding domain-containing protein
MNISAPGSPLSPTPDIHSLARGLDAGNPERSAETARQFEGLFVSMLLKELRQSDDDGGLFAGDASDTYGALFDQFMGQHLAQQGAFGIGDLVQRHVTGGAET